MRARAAGLLLLGAGRCATSYVDPSVQLARIIFFRVAAALCSSRPRLAQGVQYNVRKSVAKQLSGSGHETFIIL